MTLNEIMEFLRVHVGAAVGAGGLGSVATTLYMQWRQRRREAVKAATEEADAIEALKDLVNDMAAQLVELQKDNLLQRAKALQLESKVLLLDAEVLQLRQDKDLAMEQLAQMKQRLDECEARSRATAGAG